MCVACGIVREFACRVGLASIGLYFAVDFGRAAHGPQVEAGLAPACPCTSRPKRHPAGGRITPARCLASSK
jgi:hypothetical protein